MGNIYSEIVRLKLLTHLKGNNGLIHKTTA